MPKYELQLSNNTEMKVLYTQLICIISESCGVPRWNCKVILLLDSSTVWWSHYPGRNGDNISRSLSQITHLVLGRCQLLGVGEVVHGDGEEDIEESVVTEQRENDKVKRVDHPVADPALGHDAVVHDLVPVFPRQDLEHRQQGDHECVEVGVRGPIGEVECAAEELHPEESEDEDEEEQKEEEGENGAHGVEKRDDEVPQWGPVLGNFEDPQQS